MPKIHRILGRFFYAAAILLSLLARDPGLPRAHPQVLKDLSAGRDQAYHVLGEEYEPFRKSLPLSGKISFIMDYPFHPYGKTVEQLYKAQSYLVPLVVNPEPEEAAAIVFCSSDLLRSQRMQETSYDLLVAFGEGKGIARKRP